jgi:hypothetical protein
VLDSSNTANGEPDLNWFYLYVADDHRYFVGPFATRDDAAKAATSDPDVTTINLILHHATEPWCEPMTVWIM